VLVPDTLLAILESFAFVVESILNVDVKKRVQIRIKGTTFNSLFSYLRGSTAHFREWSISEQVAVASVGPVLSLIELVFSLQAGLCPDLLGDFFQIGVSALSGRQVGSSFFLFVFLASSDIQAADFNSTRDADVVGDGAVFLGESEADEKSGKFHFLEFRRLKKRRVSVFLSFTSYRSLMMD
jgi:hypothetical protein